MTAPAGAVIKHDFNCYGSCQSWNYETKNYPLLMASNSLNNALLSVPTNSALVLRDYRANRQISFADILYLEASVNYVTFHLVNGSTVLVSYTMARYQSLPGFIRIHKRYMVNCTRIVGVTVVSSMGGWIRLSTGIELPVSRRRATGVLLALSGKSVTQSVS